MVHKSKDVVGGGSVKDQNGKVVVNEPDVMETWRQYYNNLLNEEFDWNKGSLVQLDPVQGPCERFSVLVVKAAILKANLVKQLALQEWYQTCLKHQTVMG